MASYMKHEIHIKEGLATVQVSGRASAEGYGEVAKALVSNSGWESGINILVDYSELDLSQATGDDIERFAQAINPYRKSLGKGLCAIVNTKPLNYGLGRMWEVFMEQYSDLHVCVFYNIDDAKRWLLGKNELK